MKRFVKALGITLLLAAMAVPVFAHGPRGGRGGHMMGNWGNGPGSGSRGMMHSWGNGPGNRLWDMMRNWGDGRGFDTRRDRGYEDPTQDRRDQWDGPAKQRNLRDE
jgi:hypothetical protein